MPEPTPITDHVDQALSRLIDEWQGKLNLEALISSYVTELQAIENAIWDVLEGQTVDNATGVNLDVIGAIVGQERTSGNDDEYRNVLRVRIAINRSNGQWRDLNAIAALLFGDIAWHWEPHPPMSATLVIDEPMAAAPTQELELLNEGAEAATRIDINFATVSAPSAWFKFSTGPGWGEGVWVSTASEHTA